MQKVELGGRFAKCDEKGAKGKTYGKDHDLAVK